MLKREEISDTDWAGKEQATQEDFIWGVGPEALYQINRAEYKLEPDSRKIKDLDRLGYSPSSICRIETLTATEETSSGQNRPKMRHRRNSGDG